MPPPAHPRPSSTMPPPPQQPSSTAASRTPPAGPQSFSSVPPPPLCPTCLTHLTRQSMDDQCPVCKSDRYLNPRLRLLVSSCYHKMSVPFGLTLPRLISPARCESCIDRLFTLGPAPCPICNKVLRKLAFIPQTFEDLNVEREVAIRRRIAKE